MQELCQGVRDMNPMSSKERASYFTDLAIFLVAAVIGIVWLRANLPLPRQNTCESGYRVTIDKVVQDHCTDSESNGLRGWIPNE